MFIDLSHIVFLGKCIADALVEFALVCIVVEQYSVGFLTIASCTSSFLEIGFERIGTVDVEHHPYVGFVDTHTKSVGSHHYTYLVFLPFALALVLHHRIKTCVVEGGADACFTEQFCHFLRATTTAGIDNSAAFHALEDMDELLSFIRSATHDIGEILALETHLEDVERSES